MRTTIRGGMTAPRPADGLAWKSGKPNGVGQLEFLFFLLTALAGALHLLRNVSIGFSITYLGCAGLLILLTLRRLSVTHWQVVIASCYAWIALLTVMNADRLGSSMIGFARLFYLFPVVMYLFGSRFSDRQSLQFWSLLLAFGASCAVSIFYQVAFGPVSWFAEASERAGTTRFGSLAGSLTVYGSIVGPACFLAWVLVRRTPIKIMIVLALLLAAVLSLQKASIAGAVLGTLLGVASARSRGSIAAQLKAGLALALIGVLLWWMSTRWLSPELQQSISVFLRGAFVTGQSDDYTILESLRQRFQDAPLVAVEFFGASSLLLGVGAFGASGALGYPDLPMMHNLLGEILIVGGVGLFGLFFANTMICGLRAVSWLMSGRPEALRVKLASGVFLLTILVGLNTGSVHFHPVIGLFYWFSMRELTVDWVRWRRLRTDRGRVRAEASRYNNGPPRNAREHPDDV